MKLLTFQDIVDMKPCVQHLPSKYIPETWSGTIIDVLSLPNVAPREKLWVARRVLGDKVLRLFAVDCAKRALSRFDKLDDSVLNAINVAEAFAHGNATEKRLKEAKNAAAAAAAATYAAAYAADVRSVGVAAAYASVEASAAYDAYEVAACTAYSVDDASTFAAFAAASASAAAARPSTKDATVYAATIVAAKKEEMNMQIEQLIKFIKQYTVIKLIPEYADTDTI